MSPHQGMGSPFVPVWFLGTQAGAFKEYPGIQAVHWELMPVPLVHKEHPFGHYYAANLVSWYL